MGEKRILFILLGYPPYLLLIGGPLWALKGHGCLNFIPEPIQLAGFAPTYPIWCVLHLRGRYADYMDLWYCDSNEADRETGWD
jgi:hypothetical protein